MRVCADAVRVQSLRAPSSPPSTPVSIVAPNFTCNSFPTPRGQVFVPPGFLVTMAGKNAVQVFGRKVRCAFALMGQGCDVSVVYCWERASCGVGVFGHHRMLSRS